MGLEDKVKGTFLTGLRQNLGRGITGLALIGLLSASAPAEESRAKVVTFEKTFGGKKEDLASSVQQTSDGGYIIVGDTRQFGAETSDVYLIKTNPRGKKQWERTFGGSDDDSAFSVQQTSDGGYIVAGRTSSFGAGKEDVYLIKTNPRGKKQWERTFGGSDYDMASSVQQTTDGGYIIAGTMKYSSDATAFDIYLIKTDSKGNL